MQGVLELFFQVIGIMCVIIYGAQMVWFLISKPLKTLWEYFSGKENDCEMDEDVRKWFIVEKCGDLTYVKLRNYGELGFIERSYKKKFFLSKLLDYGRLMTEFMTNSRLVRELERREFDNSVIENDDSYSEGEDSDNDEVWV